MNAPSTPAFNDVPAKRFDVVALGEAMVEFNQTKAQEPHYLQGFGGDTSNAIIAAARHAGVHEMIVTMRDGYDTQIGEQGHALSAGQAQRIALARALAIEPRILLLDEPFGALDALTRAHLQDSVMAIHGKLGNTVLMITHDVDEAVLLSDRIVMMTNGPAATIGEVLAIDLPGHGKSALAPTGALGSTQENARHVLGLARSLRLERPIIMGHSMGGVVSTVFASTFPGRAKAFILIDSTICMPPDRIANMHAVGNREGRHYATQKEFLANYKVRPAGSVATPEVIQHIARHSGRPFEDGRWRYKVDRRIYAMRERMDSFPYWNNIKIPALLVKGDRSARITPEVIAEVKSRAPQVEVAEVSNSDHHVTLDNPLGFVHVMREFINKNK